MNSLINDYGTILFIVVTLIIIFFFEKGPKPERWTPKKKVKKKDKNFVELIGKHPKTESKIYYCVGQYGPFVKCGEINAIIPERMGSKKVSLKNAIILIEKRRKEKNKKK